MGKWRWGDAIAPVRSGLAAVQAFAMIRAPPNRWPAPTHVAPLCLQGNLDLKSDPWPKVRPV